jgi:aspartokinase/homoserine dehydrogenase 1
MKEINIYLVGTGNIGSTLLAQIERKNEFLQESQDKKINVIALADNEKRYFSEDGVDLSNWQETLKSGEAQDLAKFISDMKNDKKENKVFVDCTSSMAVSQEYSNILKAGIHIVTPNKKANTDTYKKFVELKNLARENKVKFLYETNVGAGLPIIGTINTLLNGGDKIIKIEAILSGTISFIFNTFVGEKKFSEIIREAKASGYTEPDPRDDLNGMDVARKILILARLAGTKAELSDIELESLINKESEEAESIEAFLDVLEKQDDEYEAMKEKAQRENKSLRYIATFEAGKLKVSLQMVDRTHPFFNLSGTDNIISITTEAYNETPLIIRGPGAGAEVTALGVYCDVLGCG